MGGWGTPWCGGTTRSRATPTLTPTRSTRLIIVVRLRNRSRSHHRSRSMGWCRLIVIVAVESPIHNRPGSSSSRVREITPSHRRERSRRLTSRRPSAVIRVRRFSLGVSARNSILNRRTSSLLNHLTPHSQVKNYPRICGGGGGALPIRCAAHSTSPAIHSVDPAMKTRTPTLKGRTILVCAVGKKQSIQQSQAPLEHRSPFECAHKSQGRTPFGIKTTKSEYQTDFCRPSTLRRSVYHSDSHFCAAT